MTTSAMKLLERRRHYISAWSFVMNSLIAFFCADMSRPRSALSCRTICTKSHASVSSNSRKSALFSDYLLHGQLFGVTVGDDVPDLAGHVVAERLRRGLLLVNRSGLSLFLGLGSWLLLVLLDSDFVCLLTLCDVLVVALFNVCLLRPTGGFPLLGRLLGLFEVAR
jgi:hypothetical protein